MARRAVGRKTRAKSKPRKGTTTARTRVRKVAGGRTPARPTSRSRRKTAAARTARAGVKRPAPARVTKKRTVAAAPKRARRAARPKVAIGPSTVPVKSPERALSPAKELSQTLPATAGPAQQDSLWGAQTVDVTVDMEEDLEPEDDEDEPT